MGPGGPSSVRAVQRDCFSLARKEVIANSLPGEAGTLGFQVPEEITTQSKRPFRQLTCLGKKNSVPRLLIWESLSI